MSPSVKLGLLLLLAALAYGQSDVSRFEQGSRSQSWQVRREAFLHLCPEKLACLPPPKAFPALMDLLEKESANPDWEVLAESSEYENYYSSIVAAVQNIAVTTGSSRAYAALVSSVYNPDSKFGLWLSAQPKAQGDIEQLLGSKYPVQRANALQLLAQAAVQDHSTGRRDSIQPIAAKKALDEDPFVRTGAIKALSILGDPASIAVIARIAGSEAIPGIRQYAQYCFSKSKPPQH